MYFFKKIEPALEPAFTTECRDRFHSVRGQGRSFAVTLTHQFFVSDAGKLALKRALSDCGHTVAAVFDLDRPFETQWPQGKNICNADDLYSHQPKPQLVLL